MPTERNLFNADHGAGKGDKERSSAWRKGYDSIDWGVIAADGFEKHGAKQVKRYGAQPVKPAVEPCVFCVDCKAWVPLSNEEYHRQLDNSEAGWFCPTCGAVAVDFAYRSV